MFRHGPGLLILPKLIREQSINVPGPLYPFSVQNFVKIIIPNDSYVGMRYKCKGMNCR